ncbi:MAG: response regulator [Acidimicrobiales bacterium]
MTPRTPVLVVDDKPANLLAVEALLEPLELDVVSVPSGEEALRQLLSRDFAVILLDIQMPDLDGFETARLIKGRARSRSIPIIFLTALDRDLSHQLEGYDAGAVDYLHKPFHPSVLRSKVAVFVELHRKAKIIDDQREELATRLEQRDAAQAALRAQAAELARSNAELERFAFVAGHDLQEPLDVVAGLVELAVDGLGADVAPDLASALAEAVAGLRGVRRHLDDLLAYAEAGTAELHLSPVDLSELVEEVLLDQAVHLEDIGATVTCDPLPTVQADRWQLGLVLSNVIDNAVRYRSERALAIHLGLSKVDDDWVVSIADNGAGIEPEGLSTLFTAFGGLDAGSPATGVGLALCRRILERHGGSIEASSVPGQGTTISLRLPSGPPSP